MRGVGPADRRYGGAARDAARIHFDVDWRRVHVMQLQLDDGAEPVATICVDAS
jgi:hypothetical protein